MKQRSECPNDWDNKYMDKPEIGKQQHKNKIVTKNKQTKDNVRRVLTVLD